MVRVTVMVMVMVMVTVTVTVTVRVMVKLKKEDGRMSEAKELEGKVDEVTEKQGAKGNYYAVKIGGKNYLYRGDSPPKTGNTIKGRYIEASYETEDGEKHTSKWLQGFEENTEVDENPFKQASKMDKAINGKSLEKKMLECLLQAEGILAKYNESADNEIKWNSEDVRSVGVSLFIERNRRE